MTMGRHGRRVLALQANPDLQREIKDDARVQRALWREKSAQIEKQRRKPISVQVQILSGRRFPLELDILDTLDDVRDKIAIKEGISPDQQSLLLNGIRLLDGTVQEVFIQDGATLFLILRNRGG